MPPWRCKACSSRFDSEVERDNLLSGHGASPFVCPDKACGGAFPDEALFHRQITDKHDKQYMFVCEECGLYATTCCEMQQHSHVHSEPLQCPEDGCGARISTFDA